MRLDTCETKQSKTAVAKESTVTVTAMQFFFLSIIQTLVTIEHAIPVSDFLSDILKDFSLSIKR